MEEKLLRNACEEVFSYVGGEFEVNIKFACKNYIRELNKQYMQKNKPTNVLSFNHDNNTKNGDIIICESIVEHEASNLGYKPEEMLLLYVVHGMLHLSGFDHKNEEERAKMEGIEQSILNKFGVKIERN